jgi:hypothetical protein
VKILLDANTPGPLARSLHRHQLVRTGDLGGQDLENSVLLSAAENDGFDVLVMCDQARIASKDRLRLEQAGLLSSMLPRFSPDAVAKLRRLERLHARPV